jgi:hypothetical protein
MCRCCRGELRHHIVHPVQGIAASCPCSTTLHMHFSCTCTVDGMLVVVVVQLLSSQSKAVFKASLASTGLCIIIKALALGPITDHHISGVLHYMTRQPTQNSRQ